MTVVSIPLYKKPVLPPAAIPNAYYGVASSFAKTHSTIIVELEERLTILTDQTINLTVADGQYGWFYVRAEIENVRFMDISVSMYGGWDGATWPEDGTTLGTTSGPLTVLDGTQEWHLFRTDFPAIGDRVFRVSFTAPEDEPEIPAPPPPAPEVAPSTPIYGVGSIQQPYTEANIRAVLTSSFTYTTGQALSLNITANNFGYIAFPVTSNPTFVDQSNNFPGGWDGASWPTNGDIGDTFGAVSVLIAGQPWKVYRTDFSGSGNKTYTVNYG